MPPTQPAASNPSSPAVSAANAEPPHTSIQKVAFASAIGCIIEWYDFFLYGVAAGLVFNKLFFPQSDPLVGTLLAYATFAVGFVARPLGGIIFGHYGDRLGRKTILVLTLIIMGVATFAIGLVPSYASIGVAAPILLVILRILQGIGIGGEWGGAVLMAVEHSPDKQRGFYGSWPQVGVPAGLALATGVVTLISLLPEDQFLAWGWRAAFLFSAVLVIIGIYIRTQIYETPAFRRVLSTQTHAAVPFVEMFRTHTPQVFQGLGARWIEGLGFNIYGVFIISYLTTKLHMPRTQALLGVTIAAVVSIFLIPVFGRLSDRIGRRLTFGIGSLLSGLLAFPAFWLMHNSGGSQFPVYLALLLALGIVYPMVYGPEAALFSELFSTRVRYTGVSFVYQFSGIFASGLTPLIATYLMEKNGGAPWLVCGYMLLVGVISAVATYLMRDRTGESIMD